MDGFQKARIGTNSFPLCEISYYSYTIYLARNTSGKIGHSNLQKNRYIEKSGLYLATHSKAFHLLKGLLVSVWVSNLCLLQACDTWSKIPCTHRVS